MGAGLMRRGVIAVVAMGLCGSAAAFVRSTTPDGDELVWVTNCIDYFIHRDGSDDIPFDQVEAEVQRSFKQWELPECTRTKFTYAGETADSRAGFFADESNINLIVWREGGGGLDSWVHDPAIISVTTNTFCAAVNDLCPYKGAVLDTDIEMNGAHFEFGNAGEQDRFDLGNVLTHEIGHMLGLDHSRSADATMFASAPMGELRKRDLDQDDIDGICSIFPLIDGVECLDHRPPPPAPEAEPMQDPMDDAPPEAEPMQDPMDDEPPMAGSSGGGGGCSQVPGESHGLWILMALYAWRRRWAQV